MKDERNQRRKMFIVLLLLVGFLYSSVGISQHTRFVVIPSFGTLSYRAIVAMLLIFAFIRDRRRATQRNV